MYYIYILVTFSVRGDKHLERNNKFVCQWNYAKHATLCQLERRKRGADSPFFTSLSRLFIDTLNRVFQVLFLLVVVVEMIYKLKFFIFINQKREREIHTTLFSLTPFIFQQYFLISTDTSCQLQFILT